MKISKQRKEEFLENNRKATSEDYEVSWDEKGMPLTKEKIKVTKGRKSKASGAKFELKVRLDLEEKGWFVDKWSNNFDLEVGNVIAAKRKFNPHWRGMTAGTGFPDFIAFQLLDEKKYKVIGVESKSNGLLSKEEKEKCVALLGKKVFNEILIARKKKVGRRVLVEYVDFEEKYN
jgi:hypothetical protein